jgi:tetratricopeptide (TPR) repeat protein
MLLVLMGAALALLAKPMAVTLPALVLLLDVWPLQRWRPAATGRARAALLLEKLPLLALAALGALTTLWAQSAAGSTSSLGALGPGLRLLNALASLAAYVGQTFRPLELSVFYPHAAIVAAAPVRALLAPAAAGLALLVLGLVLAWRARHRAPGALLGLALFLLLLAPVIGLVQVGTQAHADRYTYLPSVGLCAALVAGAVALGAGRRSAALGFAVSALLGVITNVQLGVWHDTRSLFAHALELDERNYLAHSKLGEVALAEGDIPAARTAFQRALDLYPRFAHALGKVALCDLAERKLEDARERLTRALAWEPDDYELRLNLGVVELERGELEAAERHFAACRARAPAGPDALLNLGVVAQRRQRWEDAQARFEEAVALAPEHGDAWSHLGQARLARGDLRAAEAAFRRAAELAPEDPLAHFNLGVALRKQSQREAAEAAFRRALALDPELEPARAALHELEAGG